MSFRPATLENGTKKSGFLSDVRIMANHSSSSLHWPHHISVNGHEMCFLCITRAFISSLSTHTEEQALLVVWSSGKQMSSYDTCSSFIGQEMKGNYSQWLQHLQQGKMSKAWHFLMAFLAWVILGLKSFFLLFFSSLVFSSKGQVIRL